MPSPERCDGHSVDVSSFTVGQSNRTRLVSRFESPEIVRLGLPRFALLLAGATYASSSSVLWDGARWLPKSDETLLYIRNSSINASSSASSGCSGQKSSRIMVEDASSVTSWDPVFSVSLEFPAVLSPFSNMTFDRGGGCAGSVASAFSLVFCSFKCINVLIVLLRCFIIVVVGAACFLCDWSFRFHHH